MNKRKLHLFQRVAIPLGFLCLFFLAAQVYWL